MPQIDSPSGPYALVKKNNVYNTFLSFIKLFN